MPRESLSKNKNAVFPIDLKKAVILLIPLKKKIQYLIKIFDFNTKAEKLTSAILLLEFFHP